MSITSTKNLGLRGSKGRIIEDEPREIFLSGDFSFISDLPLGIPGILRLNSDLTVDTTFDVGAGFSNLNSSFDNLVEAGASGFLEMNDGRLLVVGTFTGYKYTKINRIVMLNSDGSIDNTFNVGTGFNNTAVALAIDSDGKILVGGSFTTYQGITYNRIIRLNSDGNIDNTFVIGSGFNSSVSDIKIQSDGKIVVIGGFSTYNSLSYNGLIRLNSDGSVDNTFTVGTGFGTSPQVNTLAIQTDGKLVIAGNFSTYQGLTSLSGSLNGGLTRINTDGSKDITFLRTQSSISQVSKVIIQTDGKIVVGGQFSAGGTVPQRIARFNISGSLDTQFQVFPGYGPSGASVNGIIELPNDELLIAGSFDTVNSVFAQKLVRVNSLNGVLIDEVFSYKFSTKRGGSITGMLKLSNGKILLGSAGTHLKFITSDGAKILSSRTVRLNRYNKIDTKFNTYAGFWSGPDVTSSDLDDTGNIIVGAQGINWGISGLISTVKLDKKTGLPDENFGRGNVSRLTGASATGANVVKVLRSGKILIGGNFTNYGFSLASRIVQLNSDGSIDSTIDFGVGFGGEVFDIKELTDGKIYIAGAFTSYKGVSIPARIIRIDSDGNRDSTFSSITNLGGTSVRSIDVQPDGKIIAGGFFSVSTFTNVVRLNSNGSVDSTFATGTGANNIIYAVKVLRDGRIALGGTFTQFNGVNCGRFIVLNSDGSIDSSFGVTADGFDWPVYSIAQPSDGNILIGGDFLQYNGNLCSKYCVLSSDGTFLPTEVHPDSRVANIIANY